MKSIKSRPVNCQYRTIHFPLTVWAAAITRLSGVVMLLVSGCLVWLFRLSLSSPAGFHQAGIWLSFWPLQCAMMLLILAGWAHILFGIRHLLLEVGVLSRWSLAWSSVPVVIAITFMLTIISGVILW